MLSLTSFDEKTGGSKLLLYYNRCSYCSYLQYYVMDFLTFFARLANSEVETPLEHQN